MGGALPRSYLVLRTMGSSVASYSHVDDFFYFIYLALQHGYNTIKSNFSYKKKKKQSMLKVY